MKQVWLNSKQWDSQLLIHIIQSGFSICKAKNPLPNPLLLKLNPASTHFFEISFSKGQANDSLEKILASVNDWLLYLEITVVSIFGI